MRPVLVFIGAPGCGKGTQATLLFEKHGYPQISTGDILRAAVARGTCVGIEAKSFMDRGDLVPDHLVIGALCERICEGDCAGGFVLDGFPRNVKQAEALQESLGPGDRVSVYLFTLDEEQLVLRMTGRMGCPSCARLYNTHFAPPAVDERCDNCALPLTKRSDDEESIVRNRLEVYKKNTAPLIPYYREKGVLHEIDAGRNPRLVFENLVQLLSA